MIVELELLSGRYHATPWGRHVNEAVPEWPPSPFRLLRALIDAWHRKHPEISADTVERLLSRLAEPPMFFLPRARASHTRSYLAQNSEDPSDKKLVFDGFAVVDRGSSAIVGWPSLSLEADLLDAARKLFGALNYLGRSESWIAARVVDDRAVGWNCVPLAPGQVEAKKEVVSVAGVVTPEAYARRGFEVPARGKTKARKLGWLESLSWGSAEAIEHTMNRPPALEPLFYLRDADALDARPTPTRPQSRRVVEAVRFAVDGRVKVPITEALVVGEQVRRNLMGSLRYVLGHDDQPSTFSGKDAYGHPTRGHSHVSLLALDDDGDGYIDALLLTSPKAFTVEEQRAIDRLKPVQRRNGHPLYLTPLRYGSHEELLDRATTVVSHTPFAPFRHWRLKRDGDEIAWLHSQIASECAERGLPQIVQLHRIPPPRFTHRRARWLDFRRSRKDDAPQPAYGVRLTFSEPVHAPFSLGYASHFGLGCFVAAAGRDEDAG